MYRCARCNDRMPEDIKSVGFQCTTCGHKVFYKERPNVKKEILAR